MNEITSDEAAAEVAAADHPLDASYDDLLEKMSPRERDVVPYALRFFVDELKIANPRDFVVGAFGYQEMQNRDLERLAPALARARSAVDVGCGWGGFARLLAEKVHDLSAVDRVRRHAVATKYLCPAARVYQGDASALGFPDGAFDLSVLRGVVEHVGDPAVPTGASGANLGRQFAVLRELARVTRDGGTACVSTGNYLHPRDGEVNRWLFHWLPAESKRAYLAKTGTSADRYWLLTWAELSRALDLCGLRVDAVHTDRWDGPLDALAAALPDLDAATVEEWRRLVHEDPRYMSSWFVLATRDAEARHLMSRLGVMS